MSFRDFVNDSRFKQEPPKKEEPTMDRLPPRKVTRQVTQMSPQRRRQVEQRDAYTESQEMLETLNEKLKQVLYRFGMSGLEQVDQAIIETCRNMMNGGGLYQPARPSKRKPGLTESVVQQTRQQAAPARRPSFIDIAAAAVSQMAPMGDMSDHLPPQVPDAPVVNAPAAPAAQPQMVNPNVVLPVSQPDAGADYYDNLDPSTLDPDALEAMLNGKGGGDVGIGMDPNMLAMIGQAAKGK